MSFAKATLSGTLVSEPEKRFTPNNIAVTSFNLQVENPSMGTKAATNEPFVVKITCWRNLAEAVTVLQKGESVLIDGKLIMNSFQTQEGVQKKLFEVEASTVDKLPGKPEPIIPVAGESGASGGYDAAPARSNQPQPSYSSQPAPAGNHFSSEDLLTEDDIPF